MSRILQGIMFFSIFLLIVGTMNYYVLIKLFRTFSLKVSWGFLGLLIVLTFGFILASSLTSIRSNFAIKGFYFGTALWIGSALLFLFFFLIADLINLIRSIDLSIPIIVAVVFLVILSIINASMVDVKAIDVASNEENIKIVQITDLHLGILRGENYLRDVVDKVKDQDPDIVFITGDLIDSKIGYDKDILKMFNEIGKPIYMVTGNHETYVGLNFTNELLKNSSIRLLRNEAVDYKGIQIIGIDDSEKCATQLSKIELQKGYKILLYHQPSGFNDAREYNIDLILSGHTHDGQIFPFNLLVHLFYNPVVGKKTIGNTTIYVSPGTGTWGPYMRFGSKNEITVINLGKKSN